jgi:hypothetical protein
MAAQVAAGKLTWSYEAFDRAHDWLNQNGYFEVAYGLPRKCGDAARPAPRAFSTFVGETERAAEENDARIAQARRVAQEIERALSMPFEQLRQEARAGMKQFSHEAVR